MHGARFDILFESVRIGPVTAPNRFYQVPHCNGAGDWFPEAVARMRGIKAEGGWGVVCTENAEISATSEIAPFPSLRIWQDADIARHALMVEQVHAHGALAGIELVHMGLYAANRIGRTPALGPSSHLVVEAAEPFQSRAMDKEDIKAVRRDHRLAAIRAKKAGFDIVYVYATQNLSIASHFLAGRYNQRSDEYGGPLENRVRLLRELLEETKDAVGDKCAVAIRFGVDELIGDIGLTWNGEGKDIVELLKDIPDLWDVNLSDWSNDSASSRFEKEGYQEAHTKFVKQITRKPVVGVGRFTSPDTMVSQVRRGVLDFVGAARPSIADPFLPKKIQEGRFDEIRECIGCNICISCENSFVPIRCTQNPTMMEEWRRGWHPEYVAKASLRKRVLIIGGGPAGLECAATLGRAGHEVTVAEGRVELGGRVARESQLPGLIEWARVRDHRLQQIRNLPNVSLYMESRLSIESIFEFGAERVVVATGAEWRRDGIGRYQHVGIKYGADTTVFTPDDIMNGVRCHDHVLVYDSDGTYLGSSIAEKLREDGCRVTLVTPSSEVAAYLALTLEQHKSVSRLLGLGVEIIRLKMLEEISGNTAKLRCIYTRRIEEIEVDSVVLVTARTPNDQLYWQLREPANDLRDAGIGRVDRIGDCEAPNTIAAAVYAGHRMAREFDDPSPTKCQSS